MASPGRSSQADGQGSSPARSLALVVALLVAACGQEPDYPPTSEGLFLRHCSRCHEADGSSATASKLAKIRVDLRDGTFQRNVSNAEIKYIMEFGVGQMQGVAGLTAAEVDSIVLHVRRLGRTAARGVSGGAGEPTSSGAEGS